MVFLGVGVIEFGVVVFLMFYLFIGFEFIVVVVEDMENL